MLHLLIKKFLIQFFFHLLQPSQLSLLNKRARVECFELILEKLSLSVLLYPQPNSISHSLSPSSWYHYHYFNLNEIFPSFKWVGRTTTTFYWLQCRCRKWVSTRRKRENIFQGSFKCFAHTSGSENKFNVYLHSIIVFYCRKKSFFSLGVLSTLQLFRFSLPPTHWCCIKLPFFLKKGEKPQNTTLHMERAYRMHAYNRLVEEGEAFEWKNVHIHELYVLHQQLFPSSTQHRSKCMYTNCMVIRDYWNSGK